MIKPIWTYGIEIWDTANASNMKPITTLQNKILRNISKAPCLHPFRTSDLPGRFSYNNIGQARVLSCGARKPEQT